MASAIEEQISRIHDLYKEADAFVREVAEFRDQVVIPAYNELRYAGHHFIHSANADSEEKRLSQTDQGGESLRACDVHGDRRARSAACRRSREPVICRRQRIEQRFPWELVSRIGVQSQRVCYQTEAALEAAVHTPPVEIRGAWY